MLNKFRKIGVVALGFFACSGVFAAELDFVPDSLKSFVSDSKAVKQITSESNYYSVLGFEVSAVRDKYPEKFTAENYLDYFDELNAVLIEVKKNRRHVEDRLIDEINILRQLWFDGLMRSALKEAKEGLDATA